MSFRPLPDFPLSPIGVRKTARCNRNGTHMNVYPYISTPVCRIPYAVRKDMMVFSGSSASRLSHDKRSAGSSRGQSQGPILGTEKMVPATSTGRGSGKERTASSGGRTLSKSSPEARSGSKTNVEKSGSKGRSAESKVGENVETNTESSKRPVGNRNSKNAPKQPKLAVRRLGKNVLQQVQNMGHHDKQTNTTQSSDERERGKKSSQSSNPGNGRSDTDGQRVRRERKASTSSSVVSSNLRTSRASSVVVSKSSRTRDFNSKAVSTDSAAKSSDVAASSGTTGTGSVPQVRAVEPNASGRRFFKSPIKPHLVKRPDRKPSKGSKTRALDRQVSTVKRQDRRDAVYDLESSSESSHQIAKQQCSLSALRKRRIEEGAARGSTSDDVGDRRQGHRVKRCRTQDLQQLNSTGLEVSGPDLRRDEQPLRIEIRVKPKVYGRWKNVSEPLRDFISVASDQVLMELLKNVRETSVPGAVKCVEELQTRLVNRIDRIKVPTSKVSTDYFNLVNQQRNLQSEVRETQDSIEHLLKLIEKTRQDIDTLSEEQHLLSND